MSSIAKTAPFECSACSVVASYAEGAEIPDLPAGWSQEGGELTCLRCRREEAVATAVEAELAKGVPRHEIRMKRLREEVLVRFEIDRDPSRRDQQIAAASKTSLRAVRLARKRLSEGAA